MTSQAVVGIDLDDVLALTNEALARFHNSKYGTAYTSDQVTSWETSFKTIWGVSDEEKARRIDEFLYSEEHMRMLPMPGAKDVIQKLGERYKLVIITARTRTAEHETRKWIGQHFPALADEIFFADAKDYSTKQSKEALCRTLGVNVLVDDAAHQMDRVAPCVSIALLFNRPWNRSFEPQAKNVRRVHTWEDIQRILL
ncbi:MAG: hypothetical protein Q8O94_04370 [bacterium]|nr:hypothetical protein [bacterium]